ncbi:MAG: hypothetical protein ACLUOC_03660 [Peptoniphilaceae bacterium]
MQKRKAFLGMALVTGAFFMPRFVMKGGESMDVIYASLIVSGLKTFAQVPKVIQPRVKVVLENLGLPELAE